MMAGEARCRACGGTQLATVYRQDRWDVARCGDCGVGSTVPWPDAADLDAAYSSAYYESRGMLGDAASRARLLAEYAARVARLEDFARPPGRLLDVGTGPGWLPAAARARGWDAAGYDTSGDAVAAARALFGPIVRRGDIDEAARAERPVDALTAYHVIEHAPDPRAFLARAASLVAPGGLLVLEAPHAGSFDVRVSPRLRRLALDVPRHLTHFTPDTLSRLVRAAGFEVLAVDGRLSSLVPRPRGATAGAPPAPEAVTSVRPSANPLARVLRRWLSGWAFSVYARHAT